MRIWKGNEQHRLGWSRPSTLAEEVIPEEGIRHRVAQARNAMAIRTQTALKQQLFYVAPSVLSSCASPGSGNKIRKRVGTWGRQRLHAALTSKSTHA